MKRVTWTKKRRWDVEEEVDEKKMRKMKMRRTNTGSKFEKEEDAKQVDWEIKKL